MCCELSYLCRDRECAGCSHVGLLGEFDFSDALTGSNHVLVLNTHNTTTPVSSELLVVVELFPEADGEGF